MQTQTESVPEWILAADRSKTVTHQPANSWSMTAADNWWSLVGSVPTVSGVRVDQRTAMSLSAVAACTRVISEGLGCMPVTLLQATDDRGTTRKATDHHLWPVLHDQPTPEQTIISWMDQQVAFCLNWGNSYTEKQYDMLGNVRALWPIHPSRIPKQNICRNGRDPSEIIAGRPGELVFYVRNDDGTLTAIPASDMLHVAGILSEDGVTGQSIIQMGAQSLGVALATEKHAGAFFKNGAVSNIALTAKGSVGKEAADRLREQWTRAFSGVENHYKTLILEDGMTAVPFSVNPEDAQLIPALQFRVTDIARLYRVAPHLIGDLTRSTNNNITQQSIEHVTYCLMPWVVRWEKALTTQLLTEAERKAGYYFKFNTAALLRGDPAARGAFYDVLAGLGALSPNDIRVLEDWNPTPDGDVYFMKTSLTPLKQAKAGKVNGHRFDLEKVEN